MVDQTLVREDEIYAEGEAGQDLSPTIQQDRHEHDSGDSESRDSESRDSESGYVESLAAYMHTIAQKPLLTSAEERNLARRVQSGCPRAKDKLIEHNMRLVIHNAKRFRERGLDFEELVQEGTFGLIRAVEKFDPAMGYKFSTYATWWIRQKAGRAIMEKGRSVRLPVHYQEQLRKLSQAENKIALELGREPSTEELAEALEVSADKVSELRYRRRPIGSLDAPVTGSEQGSGEDKDSGGLVSFIGDDEQDEESEEYVHYTERRERLWQCLSSLPERDRYVLGRRYGLMGEGTCTLEELARELGTNREVVRQVQKRAEKRLKTTLGTLEAA